MVGQAAFGSPVSADVMGSLALAHPLVDPPHPRYGAKAFRPMDGLSLATLGDWLGGLVASDAAASVLTPLSKGPVMSPRKGAKKDRDKTSAKAEKKEKKEKGSSGKKAKSAKTKYPTGDDDAPTGGAAARKQRLAAKVQASERAEREGEARRRMDKEASDFLPQSNEQEEGDEVEVRGDGESQRTQSAKASLSIMSLQREAAHA